MVGVCSGPGGWCAAFTSTQALCVPPNLPYSSACPAQVAGPEKDQKPASSPPPLCLDMAHSLFPTVTAVMSSPVPTEHPVSHETTIPPNIPQGNPTVGRRNPQSFQLHRGGGAVETVEHFQSPQQTLGCSGDAMDSNVHAPSVLPNCASFFTKLSCPRRRMSARKQH